MKVLCISTRGLKGFMVLSPTVVYSTLNLSLLQLSIITLISLINKEFAFKFVRHSIRTCVICDVYNLVVDAWISFSICI